MTAMQIDLDQIKSIHFIGIGGIGVSAVARMMLLEGKQVSGSDTGVSQITAELTRLGGQIHIGHHSEHLPAKADLVVYTIAVPADNPELIGARSRGVKTLTYPEFLGLISQNKRTVAVAGTHGKTTTTAMLATINEGVELEASVIVGSLLNGRQSNFVAGQGDILIVEACEYQRSFLQLYPQVLVITNIEADHLDYYQDLSDIQSAFQELLERVPKDGAIITDPEAENIRPILKTAKARIIDYTREPKSKLPQPGRHNISNAQAALATAKFLGVDEQQALSVLADFAGTWRRFEYKGQTKAGVVIYDDYAHHPSEIRATISAFREKYPDRKLTVLFQPHLYSRTKALAEELVQALSEADQALLLPIYAAREPFDPSISSEDLANDLAELGVAVQTAESLEEAETKLLALAEAGEVVVTMGAGDVYKVGEELLK